MPPGPASRGPATSTYHEGRPSRLRPVASASGSSATFESGSATDSSEAPSAFTPKISVTTTATASRAEANR